METRADYDLVQVEQPTFCQIPMSLAILTRLPHFWYHADSHEQRKRATLAILSVEIPVLALALKMCSDRPRVPTKKASVGEAFREGVVFVPFICF